MSWDALWTEPPDRWLVYVDDELVVVDKPAGMPSVPEPGRDDDALSRTRRLLRAPDSEDGPPLSPSARLDRLASGLVVYGRSTEASRSLAAQFERGIRRCYVAGLVESGTTHARPGRTDGRPTSRDSRRRTRRQAEPGPDRRAVVSGESVAQARRLVEVATDHRRQEVRAQLARSGRPIAGDPDHGGPAAPRLMLHLASLDLEHPHTGAPMHFECPTPAAMQRWLEPGEATLADRTSLELALRDAAARRWRIAAAGDTTTFRVFNGEGDGIAGLTVDRYGDYLVASLVDGAAQARERVLDAMARLGARGVYLKLPPRDPRHRGPQRTELAPSRAVRGVDAPERLWVSEEGLEYEVRLADGLATGLFVDQRANRRRVRAQSDGRQVLNLFAYTGSFTVAAIAGGASRTVTVDVSRPILDWAARNVERARERRGRARADATAHTLVRADAFEWLRGAARRGERFDLVVVDPPSFATTRTSRFSAATDYPRLATAALHCLAPGGQLLACTNHRGIGPAAFAEQIARAVVAAGRAARRSSAQPTPVDCPTLPGQPCHLKAVWVELES